MADDEVPNPLNNPLFAHFQQAMSGQGPLQWDVARQTALMAATQGVAEHNVDPQRRIALEGLARVVCMHATDSGVPGSFDPSSLEVVNRATWVQHTLVAWKPYFDALARALSGPSPDASSQESSESAVADPMFAMLANVSRMIAPSMLGMSVGNLVGRLAVRTFGQYDLPLPREPHGALEIVVANVDAFADEWTIPRDDMSVWALSHEVVSLGVFSVGHLRTNLGRMVTDYAAGFRPDPGSMSEGLSRIDVSSGDPMRMLDSLLSDPTLLLGASRSDAQDKVGQLLDAAVSAVVGYVDHQVDSLSSKLLGDGSRIAEAVRRRRVSQTPDRVFVERLLGVDLTTERVALGRRFVEGVVERAGDAGAAQLLERPDGLPTPAELDAPGLWLARLETTGNDR